MKKKYAAALGVTLAVSAAVVGIASQNQTTGTSTMVETEAKNTELPSSKANLPKGRFEIVHGEVTAVGDNTMTINVAKRTEDGDSELTGETKKIAVTDDTVIREDMRGKFGQRGRRPEKANSGETSEQAGNGQKPDGQLPEKPDDGEAPEQMGDGQPPEMPADGNRPNFSAGNGFGGQKPDGQPPEKPDDEDSADSGVPNGEPPMRPGNDAKMGGMDKQGTLTLADISKGDEIAVFYDEDGNLKFIEVCNGNAKATDQSADKASNADKTDKESRTNKANKTDVTEKDGAADATI